MKPHSYDLVMTHFDFTTGYAFFWVVAHALNCIFCSLILKEFINEIQPPEIFHILDCEMLTLTFVYKIAFSVFIFIRWLFTDRYLVHCCFHSIQQNTLFFSCSK
jgi:hypothetical protein